MPDAEEPLGEQLTMPDAEVFFYPGIFSQTESEALFTDLANNVRWSQQSAVFAGKAVPLPRLTAWYGDAGKSYSYSGITVQPKPWTETLMAIKQRVEAVARVPFNSVLLNYYRNEQDSVSWHSDDEPELGTNPVIASVSFGATRKFQFKHKHNNELRSELELTPGSLLLMQGTTQHFWKHQIPKTKQSHGGRINLTFRVIYS